MSVRCRGKILFDVQPDFFVAFFAFVDKLNGPERWSTGPIPGWRFRKPGALGRNHEKVRDPEVPERLPHRAITAPAFYLYSHVSSKLHVFSCARSFLVSDAIATNTGHGKLRAPVNRLSYGFCLETGCTVSSPIRQFNLILALDGETDSILRIQIRSAAPSSACGRNRLSQWAMQGSNLRPAD